MHSVFDWISQYGYAGLFVLLTLGILGLPVPDETLLTFCGYLVWRGQLHPVGAFFAGFGGSMCGISLSYFLGRTFGHRFVHRFGRYVGATEARIEHIHAWFERLGSWLLAVGYFIPGVRHFSALVAGMTRLAFPKFAIFAYLGAACWVAAFLSLGYFVGDKWEETAQLFDRYMLFICLAIAAVLLAVWFYRKRQNK